MKKSIFLSVSLLVLTIFAGRFIASKVSAQVSCGDGWVNVGSCVANSCGTSEGLQTQTKTTPGYTTPVVCEKECPTVSFSASHEIKVWDSCPTGWEVDPSHEDKCRQWSIYHYHQQDRPHHHEDETFGPISVHYGDKSADNNHCHRPTGVSLGVPSWAMSEFNTLNVELSTVNSTNCTGGVWIPEVVERRTVPCSNAENVACPTTSPTASPTPTESGTPEPTETPNCDGDCPTESPTPTTSATPEVTPTPDNGDVCENVEGIQTGLPGPDWYFVGEGSKICRQFQYGGPQTSNGGAVLGASTSNTGSVLGASTMAGTGSFAEVIYQAIMGLGATLSFKGIKTFKGSKKK